MATLGLSLFFALIAVLLLWGITRRRLVLGIVPFDLWTFVKKESPFGLGRVLKTRITSTYALLSDVFLKRIRGLGTKVIKNIPELSPLVAFNYINDLDDGFSEPKLIGQDSRLQPTEMVTKLIMKAKAYPTNLWFDTEKLLNEVIMAGQMSACHSLLRHLWDLWNLEEAEKIRLRKAEEQKPQDQR